MISRWLRLGRRVPCWLIAVALACGPSATAPGCGQGDGPSDSAGVEYGPQDCGYYGCDAGYCTTDAWCVGIRGPGWVCDPVAWWCVPAGGDADADADGEEAGDDGLDDAPSDVVEEADS